jgi:hypothetical protein
VVAARAVPAPAVPPPEPARPVARPLRRKTRFRAAPAQHQRPRPVNPLPSHRTPARREQVQAIPAFRPALAQRRRPRRVNPARCRADPAARPDQHSGPAVERPRRPALARPLAARRELRRIRACREPGPQAGPAKAKTDRLMQQRSLSASYGWSGLAKFKQHRARRPSSRRAPRDVCLCRKQMS